MTGKTGVACPQIAENDTPLLTLVLKSHLPQKKLREGLWWVAELVGLWFAVVRNEKDGGTGTSVCFRNDLRVSPHQ